MKTSILTLFVILLLNVTLIGQEISSIEIYATDIIHNPSNQMLYAVVGKYDNNYKNSFVVIDPETKTITDSITLNAEPSCMAITRNNEYIYIGYSNASIVSRIRLKPLELVYNINLGSSGNDDYFAEDLTTLFNRDDIVIVSKRFSISHSPRHAGVVVYKEQVKLENETGPRPPKNMIVSANDTNLVFGLNIETTGEDFSRMVVDTANGISLIDIPLAPNTHSFDSRMKLYNSLLYIDDGEVFNPFIPEPYIIGNFEGIPPLSRMEINLNLNKAYFISQEYGKVYFYHYNATNFKPYGRDLIEYITPSSAAPISLVALEKYSKNGIVLIINENYLTPIRRVVFYEGCNVLPSANLEVTQEMYDFNDTLNIIVSNEGQLTAKQVTVIDTLTYPMILDTAVYSSGYINITDNVLIWSIDSLVPNSSDTLRMNLKSSICEDAGIMNNIFVESATTECDLSDNEKQFGIYLKGKTCNGLEDEISNSDKLYEVYPNPATDMVHIKCLDQRRIELHDLSGKLLKEWNTGTQTNSSTINIGNLPQGIYILKIRTTDTTYNSKLLKK